MCAGVEEPVHFAYHSSTVDGTVVGSQYNERTLADEYSATKNESQLSNSISLYTTATSCCVGTRNLSANIDRTLVGNSFNRSRHEGLKHDGH